MAVRSRLLPLWIVSVAAAGNESDPKASPEFKARVNAAIDRGLAWLLARQGPSGRFPAFQDARGAIYPLGMHALATLAVLKCGHPVDSKELRAAFAALHALEREQLSALRTYEAALVLMALDGKLFPPVEGAKRRPPRKPKLDAEDAALAQRMLVFLQSKQEEGGLWRYPGDGQDLSNTQYAILGLWSASRLGLDVNRGVVRRAVETTLAWQQRDGPAVERVVPTGDLRYGRWSKTGIKDRARGWRYMPDYEKKLEGGGVRKVVYPYSGSMTAAGIAILAIGRELLAGDAAMSPEFDRRIRQSVYDGFAWLAKRWEVADNPGQRGNWPFYWIYGLERAAQLAGLENVGEHDWYFEGATELLNNQREDGSWPKRQRMRPPKDANVQWWSDQVDTAFALLFLTKSTPNLDIPAPVTSGGG